MSDNLTLDKIQLIVGRIVLNAELQINTLQEQLRTLQLRVEDLEKLQDKKSKAA
jgi:TolA-binding protein